jgi:hypothetical protein
MAHAITALCGCLDLCVLTRNGDVRARRRHHNTVLTGGRRFAASALLSIPSDVRFDIVLGTNHRAKTRPDMDKLIAQIAELRVKEPSLVDDQIVLQAHYDPDEELTVGESGVRLHHRRVGGGNRHYQVLYNRAVIDGGVTLVHGESLSLTWTLGFTAVTG